MTFTVAGLAVLIAVAGAQSQPTAAPPTVAPRTPICADVLARMRMTPRHVLFVGCRSQPDRQGKPLVATYRVDGRHAAAAEAAFARAFGLERLRRSCCLWDAPAHGFRGPDGRDYTIVMSSDETKVATRAHWSRIASFRITVETPTEEI